MSPTRTLPRETTRSTVEERRPPPRRRRWIRITLISLGALVLLPILFFVGIVAGINPLFRWSLERIGSKAVHVPVHVGKASMSFAGRAKVNGLRVDNPPGYPAPAAFTSELITTQASVRSIFEEKIQIAELVIVHPELWYESGPIGEESNWGTLMKNLARSHTQEGERPPEDHEKKFIIRRLRIVGPIVHVHGPLAPNGVTLRLRDIDLHDIGNPPAAASKTYVVFVTVFKAILDGALREGKSLPPDARASLALDLAEAAKTFSDVLRSVK